MKQHNAQETLDVQQNKEPSSDVKSKKEEAITEKISRGQPDTGEPHKAPKRKRTCKKN
jgi:hypothetical protein